MNNWEIDISALSQIHIASSPHNGPVTIAGSSPHLTCIGVGTDAAVFQSRSTPAYAYKLYAKDKLDRAAREATVYKQLSNSPYFPTCFAAYDRFLVLSFEEGKTLYDCILQGIHIPRTIVDEVEEARNYIRSQGLNPRDIHLKNILLQNGKAKMLDVSEYAVPGDDARWTHLKQGYTQYYSLIDGNAVPHWLVATIEKWYNQQRGNGFSYEEFMKTIAKLFYKK